MRLGVNTGYWGSGPPAGVPETLAEAERLGFDSMWTAEAYGSDCFTPLAWWGAGTSTLIKCISGVHRLDSGSIEVDGAEVLMSSPAVARANGIETVYQDLALFDNLDTTGNFYAGREIAVVLKGYPRLSETFIAEEIRGLEARGLALRLYALRRPTAC